MPGVEIRGECPVSRLSAHPELLGYVEEFFRSKRLREASGAAAVAAALPDWPAVMADAWEVMAQEEIRYDNARQEALRPRES